MRLPAVANFRRSHGPRLSFRYLSFFPYSSTSQLKSSVAAVSQESSPTSSCGRPKAKVQSAPDLPFTNWCRLCGISPPEYHGITHKHSNRGQGSADFIFSALLNKYAISKEAANVLIEMVESGVFPREDFRLWPLVYKMCRSGHVDEAWDLVHALQNGGGLVDTLCCNHLLSGLKKIRDFDRVDLLFSEMKHWSVSPDHITYSIVLNNLCKTNRVDNALKMLEDLSVRNQSTANHFTYVIDGLCKSGRLKDGLELLESMKLKSGCSPNSIAYTCLIKGYCKVGDFDTTHYLLKCMKDENVPRDVFTLNSIIDGLCRTGRQDEALSLATQMQKFGLMSDTVTYNTLIASSCRAGDIDAANKLLRDMIKRGNKADVVTYGSLIYGFCRAEKSDQGMTMFRRMSNNAIKPNNVIYSILIISLCRQGKIEEALSLLDEMKSERLVPTTSILSTMLCSVAY